MTVLDAVPIAWRAVQQLVEGADGFRFDHEFTLQFHFAWEVARVFGFSAGLSVRFEVPCGNDLNGETIRLDLLLWTDPKAKVAVELKAPLRSDSGMNSAMTQFRMRFYRDIHRLRHLVETRHDGIAAGVFLAVVNERGYVMERRQVVNAAYRTYHGTQLAPSTKIAATQPPNGYPFEMQMPAHEITWKWSCREVNGRVECSEGLRHFWLNPIVVTAPGGP